MFLLPRIELSKGECVHALDTGLGEALPLTDPKEVALRFQAMGAVGLHVIDVDAAQGRAGNDEALFSILEAVHVPVQFGGGVRSLKRIQELRDTGARRVIIGTMSVLHPDWFQEAVRCFPQGLLANVDEKDGKVWIKGRSQDTGKDVGGLVDSLDGLGLEGIVITSLNGTSQAQMLEWAKARQTPIMVESRVKDVEDLLALRRAGIRGAILGREIYERTIDFDQANRTLKGN